MINVYLKKAEDELRLRNYSPKTIKNYIACLADYLCAKKGDFESVDTDFIKRFLLHKKDQGKSPRTTNQSLQAINFFCRNILKSHCGIDIKFAKTPSKLPIVLSRGELQLIIDSINNEKHCLM